MGTKQRLAVQHFSRPGLAAQRRLASKSARSGSNRRVWRPRCVGTANGAWARARESMRPSVPDCWIPSAPERA